jgi:predicted TIM-barrel fold metal-dependent hydrolase
MRLQHREDSATQGTDSIDVRRRRLVGTIGAAGAASLLPFGFAAAQAPARAPRIDVHHHIVSPGYSAALKERGQRHTAWTVQGSLADMDKSGIATSVTSLIQPAVWFGDVSLGRKLAREANEFAAKLVRDYPGRFGTFATIPYPDTEGSLGEIAYALDTLKAEGFCLMTSYGGKYLGDPAFWPVLEELNRRSAVVYTHPLSPQCCGDVVPGLQGSTIEYATDTTRTMASLIFTGAAAKYPNIRWIFSHSGGTAPYLLSRFIYEEKILKDREAKIPKGVLYELAKFYYDTAQGNHAGALDALLRVAPVSQLLYGTDYPFRDGAEVNAGLAAHGFSAAELRAIDRDNAVRMMPKLKG